MRYFSILPLISIITIAVFVQPVFSQNIHPITGDELAKEQIFQYSISAEFNSLDPQLAKDDASVEIVRDLFEGLMNQDSKGNLVPGVATHFSVNRDYTVFTFYLRSNAMWSDGKPVTANDFVYAWRRAANPETKAPSAWLFGVMKLKNATKVLAGKLPIEALGVKALDGTTFKVSLSETFPSFPILTTKIVAFPIPRWALDSNGGAWTRPENIVSNGAYILSKHIVDRGSIRIRNPKYWNNEATIIKSIVTNVIGDKSAALKYFLSGQLDRTDIPRGRYAELKSAYPKETRVFPRLCVYYYIFNFSDPGPAAFQDVRVRKALSYGD